jgi:hypothetical protein
LLRRHYPASTLLRPCPTPVMAAACRDVEAATLARNGSPPIIRTTFPTCRAHYPGGSSGCACRLLPRSFSLPQMTGGSASALSLSRPAQASLALRAAGSLNRLKRPLSRGSSPPPVTQPSRSSASGSIDNYPVVPSSTGASRLRGARSLGDIGECQNHFRSSTAGSCATARQKPIRIFLASHGRALERNVIRCMRLGRHHWFSHLLIPLLPNRTNPASNRHLRFLPIQALSRLHFRN